MALRFPTREHKYMYMYIVHVIKGKIITSSSDLKLLVLRGFTSNRKLKPEVTGHRTRLYLYLPYFNIWVISKIMKFFFKNDLKQNLSLLLTRILSYIVNC